MLLKTLSPLLRDVFTDKLKIQLGWEHSKKDLIDFVCNVDLGDINNINYYATIEQTISRWNDQFIIFQFRVLVNPRKLSLAKFATTTKIVSFSANNIMVEDATSECRMYQMHRHENSY